MKNQKRELVISTVVKREGTATGIAVGVAVIVELIVYLMEALFSFDFQSFLVSLAGIPGSLTNILTLVLMIYFLITPYSDFKWAIQNGISRKIVWQGRLISLTLLTLVVWFINQLLKATNGSFFGIKAAGYSLVAYYGFAITMMAIGNGFALLNRRWKWLVGIGGPVALFVLVSFSLVTFVQNFINNEVVIQLLMTSATWWTVLIIYLIVMIFLGKLFNDKMQLRRD